MAEFSRMSTDKLRKMSHDAGIGFGSIDDVAPLDEEGGLDFFEMLNEAQGNRLDRQRSDVSVPGLVFHTDTESLRSSSPASESNVSLASASHRDNNRIAFLRKLTRSHTNLVPLAKSCTLYFDSTEGVGVLPDSVDHEPNALVTYADGWKLETRPPLSEVFSEYGLHTRFYRDHFFGQDHSNYVGTDEALGSVVVSLRREQSPSRPTSQPGSGTKLGLPEQQGLAYRAIVRTQNAGTKCLVIPESDIGAKDEVPSLKDVVQRIIPDIEHGKLKQARINAKLSEEILKVDQCNANPNKEYKFGLLNLRGPCSEEAIYKSNTETPAFQDFMETIGERIMLEGYKGYRGGLDVNQNTTGAESLVASLPEDGVEIMFHVSTMLPFTEGDSQQVLRKRHIGNDIVTVVFQERNAAQFKASAFTSHFHHVFIVVRVENAGTDRLSYTVSTVRKGDVPPFGPSLPPQGQFSRRQIEDGSFRTFLLKKLVEAEHASYSAGKLRKLAERTRSALLEELVTKFASDVGVGGNRRSGLGRSIRKSIRRKASTPQVDTLASLGDLGPDLQSWSVKVDALSGKGLMTAMLAISPEMVILVDNSKRAVIHNFPANSMAGWFFVQNGLRLFYGKTDSLTLHCSREDTTAISQALQTHTSGHLLLEIMLKRDGPAQPWGFTVLRSEVTNVAPGGIASRYGLTTDHQLFEVNGVPVGDADQLAVIEAIRTHDLQVHLMVLVKDGSAAGASVLAAAGSASNPSSASAVSQQAVAGSNGASGPVGTSTPRKPRASKPRASTQTKPPQAEDSPMGASTPGPAQGGASDARTASQRRASGEGSARGSTSARSSFAEPFASLGPAAQNELLRAALRRCLQGESAGRVVEEMGIDVSPEPTSRLATRRLTMEHVASTNV